MTIESYIQNQVLLPRVREKGVLVIYDPTKQYRELSLGLAGPKVVAVDASTGSIEAREQALEALAELGYSKTKREGVVVYTTASKPQDEEHLQKDPFSIYIACGRVFPDGDGDTFENICLKARPEHAVEVRKLFATNPNPDFAVINQIGGGPGWPQLQSALGADSATNILFALLVPSPKQQDTLRASGETWVDEAKELFHSCLGLKLVTKGKTWSSIADELWRYLLFSEFVFDLPGKLPAPLAPVPKAGKEARQVVEDLCDRLRNDQRTSAEYVRRAEGVEKELNLPILCKSIEDLGVRDTFPFEERTFLALAQKALLEGNLDRVRTITAQHAASVWRSKGENQARWSLISAAAALVERCEDLRRAFPKGVKDMTSLVRHYVGHLREADRLHREFELAAEGCLDSDDGIDAVVVHARRVYRGLADDAHVLFLRFLNDEGWPASGLPANWDTFDRFVGPLLQEKGNRVALILVDALRYELGLELKRQIADDGLVEIEAACAAMPTVTPVGMASLLPEAGTKLRLNKVDGDMVPYLGDAVVKGLSQRMKVLLERYGQRFQEMKLTDFFKAKKSGLPERVDLLVLRTTEMDTQMELSPQMSAPVVSTLGKVGTALNRLRERGFTHVVIATDHGFVLNATAESGDVCAKPQGDWIIIHDRAALGSGVGDQGTMVIPAAKLGIRGDFESFGTPRSLAPYKSGLSYFHGGASLQEAIVPILRVKLGRAETATLRSVSVTLSYRNGASRITTQRPVIEVLANVDDIFALEQTVEVLIEARDSKDRIVGEAKPGGPVNPATGILQLTPGEKVQVPLKMLPMEEFEGKFTVKAINPATLAQYGEGLKLETDYTG